MNLSGKSNLLRLFNKIIMKLSLKRLSFFIFFIPTFTVILSYIFSLYLNLVPSCIPILDGCTSISRTGRYFPVNVFFKTLMFVSGILILLYWYKNYDFFNKQKSSYILNISCAFGFISIIFLFLYLIFLGENNYYKFFRKIGVFIYLFFSVISELLLSIIYKINYKNMLLNQVNINYKLILSIFLLSIGIIFLPLMTTKIENVSNLRNIISWNYFLLIQVNFLLTFMIWRQ